MPLSSSSSSCFVAQVETGAAVEPVAALHCSCRGSKMRGHWANWDWAHVRVAVVCPPENELLGPLDRGKNGRIANESINGFWLQQGSPDTVVYIVLRWLWGITAAVQVLIWEKIKLCTWAVGIEPVWGQLWSQPHCSECCALKCRVKCSPRCIRFVNCSLHLRLGNYILWSTYITLICMSWVFVWCVPHF